MKKWQLIEKFLIKFIQEEITKTGLKKGVCGLSGGIDSAVVAVLAKKALGENFKAFLLPSQYSSKSSVDDALKLCENFDIDYEIISIAPLLEAYMPRLLPQKALSYWVYFCIYYRHSAPKSGQ